MKTPIISTYITCLLLALSFWARSADAATTIGTFTGGDPGEGLDLQGKFIYAIGVGTDQAPGKAGDANFTMDDVPGVTVVAVNRIVSWLQAEYGDSPADDVLDIVMHSIRWSPSPQNPEVTLANLTPGASYKLQLLFGEACCNRGFDVLVDGVLIADDFNPGVVHEGINNLAMGAVVTYDFIAKGASVTITLDSTSTAAFSDHNPILNGLTLEETGKAGDVDNDGLPDAWEQLYFKGLSETANGDPDKDGLTNAEELAAGTNPTVADTDGDGLLDGAEVKTHKTNPNKADTDGDGLSDGAEVNTHGTNPNLADTDGDGLKDGVEINVTKTNPKLADSDGDGFNDYAEIHLLTNPMDAASKPRKTTANMFFGANPGQGLDLDGTFVYAINAANALEGGQIRDAFFTTDDVDGVTLESSNVANAWNPNVVFGDTPEQLALAEVLASIRWSNAGSAIPALTLNFANLQIGASYKLQLLFGEYLWARGFNVLIDGKLVAKEFAPYQWQGGLVGPGNATPRTNGVVITHGFIANKTSVTIVLDGRPVTDTTMGDHNSILNGATLELVAKATDSDGDGLWDAWEMENFGNLNQKATDDPDKDGLTNLEEQTLGSDPNNADGDGDGLTDGDEVKKYKTDPSNADTDGDGLKDGDEVLKYKSDPNLADTDGDGLSDGAEVLTYKTDPLKADTDGDGVSDSKEVAVGTDPLKAGKPTTVKNIVIQSFSGGDPGEGLDLQGRFIYAFNVSSAGAAGKAGDADFTADTAPGIKVTAANNIPAWDTPNYGDSPADKVIAKVTSSIRYDRTWRVELSGLIPGSTYKLQLLFYEQCCAGRGFNVTIDGALIAEGFMPADIQGGVNNTAAGSVISAEFTTYGDKAVIIGDGPAGQAANPLINDTNAILDGVTLEVLNEAPKPTSVTNIVVQSFTGGDPGEGLDLQGTFLYAFNVSTAGAAGQAGDANFTADNVPGVTVTAANNIAAWDTPNYGDTPADKTIALVTSSIRYGSTWRVEMGGLVPGNSYKVQLLFYEQCCAGRGFDVTLDGKLIAEAFMPATVQGGVNKTSAGAMISAEFTTYTTNVVIIGDGPAGKAANPAINDTNAILDGVTLEVLKPSVAGPALSVSRAQGNIVITYEGNLQSSDKITGPFTDDPGTSPRTLTPGAKMKFYRAVR